MTYRASLPILTTNGRSFSNTPLGRSISINSSMPSIRPVFLSSSCSNFISPSRLSLKKLKPEPWQRLFEGKKQQDLSVNKNQSNIENLVNENVINISNEPSVFDETSQSSFIPTPIQTHINQLYEQIEHLTAQLSEERFKHKQTRINATEKLVSELKNQEIHFNELLKQKSVDYENQLNEQENKYSQLIDEQRIENAKREQELKQKVEFLKKSFHIYKVNTEKGNSGQIQMKSNEALVVMKDEKTDKDEEIYNKIHDTLRKERNHMNEKQKNEIENLKKQYQSEFNELQKSLVNAAENKKSLESLYQELSATKIELNQSNELVINLSTRLKDLEMQHIKSMRELNDYRERYNDKIREVEKINSEVVNH